MSASIALILRDIAFSYDQGPSVLFQDLSVSFPTGFTGIIGPNGSGKTTLLRLATRLMSPQAGEIVGPERAVYCAQRTDDAPASLAAFLDDWSADASRLRGRLGIEADFEARWSHLSHGERKRAQIGFALWQQPDVLAVDEPTNHIDNQARDLLLDNLQRFGGVGLLVSHDRALLDALCVQCVWVAPPGVQVYAGGYSEALAQRHQDSDSAAHARALAVKERARLEREISRRRGAAAQADSKSSKRHLARGDSDGRARIDLARLSGKDGQAGRLQRQWETRAARNAAAVERARVEKTYDTGIWLPGSRSRRSLICDLPAGHIALAPGRALSHPPLVLRSDHDHLWSVHLDGPCRPLPV